MSQKCLTKKTEEEGLTSTDYLLSTWLCDDKFKQDYFNKVLQNQDSGVIFSFIFKYKY